MTGPDRPPVRPACRAVTAALLVLVAGCGLAPATRPPAAGAGRPTPAAPPTVPPRATEAGPPPAATTPPVPADAFAATVERVVDGDTFVARRAGARLRVRVIGVNTPETVKPGAPVECYGPQAHERTAALLPPGATVRAAYEPGGRTDRYGRELWDVWLPDGRFLAGVLAAEGAARPLAIRPQTRYAGLLAGLADDARRRGRGLWGACSGATGR